MTLFLLVALMLAFASPAMAACPKATKTCSAGSTCGTCKTCTDNLCVDYLKYSGKEYARICNKGPTDISLSGKCLCITKCKGCAEKKYKLPALTVKAGKCVWVYTCKGTSKGNVGYLGVCGDLLIKGSTAKICNC